MNSLLQSQIHENCKLSLPDGLKDLMNDISREVLRAQPQNVYQFIANYLQALLEVREAISIAHHICDETCVCSCELESELKAIGLEEEDFAKAMEVIQEHLKRGAVNEPSVLMKLVKNISIDEFHIPAIQEAIQRAFKRGQLKNTKTKYIQNNDYDEIRKAIQHTMHVYETSKPKTEELFISTYVKPCTRNDSSACFANYQARDLKHGTYDFEPSEKEGQCLHQHSTANDIDTEFNEKTKDSEICDENIIENYVSGDDDETDHTVNPQHVINDFDEVRGEDIIHEEIEYSGSVNDSIVSSVKESLPDSDYSDEEVF